MEFAIKGKLAWAVLILCPKFPDAFTVSADALRLLMQIDNSLILAIERVPWLKACGKTSSLSVEKNLRQVATWAEADDVYDEGWETIKNQQQNLIAATLSTQYREKFNQWNSLIEVAKHEVSQRIAPALSKMIEDLKLNAFYVNAICRDIHLYTMELTYAKEGCVVPIFFRNLYIVYEAGHFPCGWGGGQFPSGYLLYY